jgi:thioesterase domain-containing protein
MQEPTGRPEYFPASFNQEALWVLDQLEPGSKAFHIPISFRLVGPLSIDGLQRSLNAVVKRHRCLRTTFVALDERPTQVIRSSYFLPFGIVDLSNLDVAQHESATYSAVCEEVERPFDLARGPLIRAAVVRLAQDHHILVLVMHHIISDGWSAEILVKELGACYAAFSIGADPNLKPLAAEYTDFVAFQRHVMRSRRMESHLSYWTHTLTGIPVVNDLPKDRERPSHRTYAGAGHLVLLDDGLVSGLRLSARARNITLYILLAALFGIILFKLQNNKDVVFGVPVSGRLIEEFESVVGLFVNVIVLRTVLDENYTVDEAIDIVRTNLLDALSHQDAPFERVVNIINAPRSPNVNPVFQIMFGTFRAALQSPSFGPLVAEPYVILPKTSRLDLNVNLIEGINGKWFLHVEYSTELFDHQRIGKMMAAYQRLMHTALFDGRARLVDLDVSQQSAHPPVSKFQGSGIDPFGRRSADFATSIESQTEFQLVSQKAQYDEIHYKLIELWQNILQVSPVGIDDDFFELGGSSLQAILLTNRMNRTFGRNIPASALFREATIRKVAARVRGMPSRKLSFVPLVETGARPPLFVAGSILFFRDLSQALGNEQPFFQLDPYALQEERMIAGAPFLTSVEDLAAHFINEIRMTQQTGPYFLGGQCDGGIIALEIARQLRTLGQTVAALMQFDTPVRGYFRQQPLWQRLANLTRRGPADVIAASVRHFGRIFRRNGGTAVTEATREKMIADAIWTAVGGYRRNSLYDGEITLFRAERYLVGLEDVATGWDRVGKVRIVDVPGDHLSMFRDQQAQMIIKDLLEELQRRVLASSTRRTSGTD